MYVGEAFQASLPTVRIRKTMNVYLKNLNKIEFVVTDACTGRCKHCSAGDHHTHGERIDPVRAADAVRKIAEKYEIRTVMAFGGEPLLYPDAVYAIIDAARQMQVPQRQVITNGYFSGDAQRVSEVARRLAACGVNDLLLSVDAFHQETIPLDVVMAFAREAKACGIPMRLSPAWLVSPTHDNPYNKETKRILDALSDRGIPVGEGNVIFPEGNALRFLADYFVDVRPQNPYAEDPCNVRCVSFCANGNVLGGNVYREDVMEILRKYAPDEADLGAQNGKDDL